MFSILASHVSMDVPDLAEAQRYLEGACGLTRLREFRRPGGGIVVWYPGLELWQAETNSTPGMVKHVAWQVDDIQAAMQTLKQSGVQFEVEEPILLDPTRVEPRYRVLYAFFTTPIGVRGEIYQVTSEA